MWLREARPELCPRNVSAPIRLPAVPEVCQPRSEQTHVGLQAKTMCLMRHVAEQYHVLAQPTEKHVGEQVCVLHGEGDVWEVFETDVAAGVLGPAAAAGSTSQVSTLLGGMRMVRAFYRGMIAAHNDVVLRGQRPVDSVCELVCLEYECCFS